MGSASRVSTAWSNPRGTLNHSVGRTSAMLARVVSIEPRRRPPASTWRLPPLRSTKKKLWLPPKVWLHGSQSTTTGGCSARNGQHAARLSWLAVSMRWVLTTPLGRPVEPDVNSTLAIVAGPVAGERPAQEGRRPGRGQTAQAEPGSAVVPGDEHRDPIEVERVQGPAVALGVVGEHDPPAAAGRPPPAAARSSSSIRAYAADTGDTGIPACIAASDEQCRIDPVVRQDHHRPSRSAAELEQRAANPLDRGQRLGVGAARPPSLHVALGHEGGLGSRLGPPQQPISDPRHRLGQRRLRAQHDAPVVLVRLNPRSGELDRRRHAPGCSAPGRAPSPGNACARLKCLTRRSMPAP